MALSADLEKAGLKAENIDARSTVTLDMARARRTSTRVHVDVSAQRCPAPRRTQFQEIAEGDQAGLPGVQGAVGWRADHHERAAGVSALA